MFNMKNIFKTCLLVALIGLPFLAHADINPGGSNSSWTVYAFGNANVIAGLIEASKGMMEESSFMTLVVFVAAFSTLVAATLSAAGTVDGKKIGVILVSVTAMSSFGLKEKSNVTVYDPVFNDVEQITDVPAIVALPASVITTMGHNLTELIEKHFTLPSSLSVSSGGSFNIGNEIISSSTKLEITSPYLKTTINRFYDDCVIPSISSGLISSGEVLNSSDLFGTNGTFSKVNPSLFTVVYTGNRPTGAVVPCTEDGIPEGTNATVVTSKTYSQVNAKGAFEYISRYIKTATPDWFKNQAGVAASDTWLANTLNAAQKFVFNTTSYDSTRSLEQAAAINSLKPSIMAMSAQTGDDSANMGFAIAQAEQSQKSSWATTAILFSDFAGYFYSVLQAFIFGLTPIIFVAMFLPGGLKMAINYGLILVWLSLWEPTLGVINYVIQLYSQGNLAGVADLGYNFINTSFIDARTNNFILAASALAAATPMISWAIIRGGYAFTSFISGNIGTSFANKAAEISATGNKSYGEVKAHNTTLDQEMSAMRTVVGNMGVGAHQGGVSAAHYLNHGQVVSNALKAQVNREVGETHKIATQVKTAAQEAIEKSTNKLKQYNEKWMNQTLQTMAGGEQTTGSEGTTDGVGASNTTGTNTQAGSGLNSLRNLLRSANNDLRGEVKIQLGAEAGGTGGHVSLADGISIQYIDKNGEQKTITFNELKSRAENTSDSQQGQYAKLMSKVFSALANSVKGENQELANSYTSAAKQYENIATNYERIEATSRDEQIVAGYSGGVIKSDAEALQAIAEMNQSQETLQQRLRTIKEFTEGNSDLTQTVNRHIKEEQLALNGLLDGVENYIQKHGGEVKHDAHQAAMQANNDIELAQKQSELIKHEIKQLHEYLEQKNIGNTVWTKQDINDAQALLEKLQQQYDNHSPASKVSRAQLEANNKALDLISSLKNMFGFNK
ncbi:conjugal transfer protein TraG N-terminal domain-containing protein [Galenea microaerophila]